MYRTASHCIVMFVSLWLSACTSMEPKQASLKNVANSITHLRQDALFGLRPEIVNSQQIHHLTAAQERHYLKYISDFPETPVHQGIANYLQEFAHYDFSYSNQTQGAAKTLAKRSGNCLSLAVLATALAKLSNVDVSYQLVDSFPVFEVDQDVIFKVEHVRTRLYNPDSAVKDGNAMLMRSNVLIDYFYSGSEKSQGSMGESGYLARYYINLAAEALAAKDYQQAYWLTVESLQQQPSNTDALNNLAIIYDRFGIRAQAELVYRHALGKGDDKVSLLKNYRLLLLRQNRNQEAESIGQKIAALDDESPVPLIRAARLALDQGQFQKSRLLFQRAVDKAPYLHEAYLGLAQLSFQSGRLNLAQTQLKKALELSARPKTQSLYLAKLDALKKLSL